jgi:hypothetical protein
VHLYKFESLVTLILVVGGGAGLAREALIQKGMEDRLIKAKDLLKSHWDYDWKTLPALKVMSPQTFESGL